MKYLFLILFTSFSYCQNITYNKIDKKGNFTEYTTKENRSIKIGDTIQIKYPINGNQFIYILQGDTPTGTILVNKKVIVSNIKSIGNKKQGYTAWVLFKNYGLLPVYINYEAAKDNFEIE